MSRLDDLRKQNPELNISLLDLIAKADPSKTNKYTVFLVRWIKHEYSTSYTEGMTIMEDILHLLIDDYNIDLLNKFENHCVANRIKNPDISKYRTFDEIEVAVKEADEIVRIKEFEKQSIKLYNDDDYLVVIPLSYEACKSYGSNTKWCVTEQGTWMDYWGEYKLIFIINKMENTKFAVSMEYGNKTNIQGWNELDNEISSILLPLPDHIINIIKKELITPKYETEFKYLGDAKILNPEGVVSIEDATEEDINQFLAFFEESLNDSFIKKLKKKLRGLGGKDSSECIDIKKGSKMISDEVWELDKTYKEEILKNNLNDVVDSIGDSDIWKHITTDNEFLRKLLNIKK